jgi:hypothetical protein
MTDTPLLLARIADALERLAPPPRADADPLAHPAYLWRDGVLEPIEDFRAQPLDLLHGIDAQRADLLDNSRRLATGLPAHDVLLWGSRGTGKSSLVKAVVAQLQAEGQPLALVEIGRDSLPGLRALFGRLRPLSRRFVLFADDISFEAHGDEAKALRSLLEGGAEARPANARLYVTSNRRHLLPRDIAEQDSAINVRDVVDDRLALSDRFGLSLGFHNVDQATYLAIVQAYARAHGFGYDEAAALAWSVSRGGRSGRVAWQYAQEAAGRQGIRISGS